MKTRSFASVVLGICAIPLVACSVSTTKDSITLKAQTKFIGAAVTKTSTTDWTGQAIEIENANGDVVVVGDASATKITVETKPFAFADGDKQADADGTIADVVASIAIDESGHFYIHCAHGASHGSAAAGTSGCDGFTVHVPAGSVQQGLTLKATSHNGHVSASGLTAAVSQQLQILSDNGDVSATGITGGVKVHTDNGGASGSVTPTPGSSVEVSSKLGDVTLALPAGFAADQITLKGSPVTVTGFGTDFTSTSTSRGAAGTGASSIAVTTDLGQCTVKAQ